MLFEIYIALFCLIIKYKFLTIVNNEFYFYFTVSIFFWRPWSYWLLPKNLHTSVAVPAALVRVPSQRPLAPSVTSVMSVANDKGENEMILGAVYRSPSICLTAEEKPGKPQLVDRLMKGLCDQSSPQMGSLSSK